MAWVRKTRVHRTVSGAGTSEVNRIYPGGGGECLPWSKITCARAPRHGRASDKSSLSLCGHSTGSLAAGTVVNYSRRDVESPS